MFPILGQQNRAASGGNHDIVELGERIDHFALSLAKSRLAFFIEDIRNIYAGTLLDLDIAVVEREIQRFRQLPPHGRFAGTHGTDEENAVHGAIVRDDP